ncbi:hexokinase-2-like [Ischnura elegans]|uniref:hexokinase-2-like n=1 Tax=Ischnura elegans TaxID=197161 RepID=UPI001ED889C0|nr:hexokinase-2-like [Ischnura elegans]
MSASNGCVGLPKGFKRTPVGDVCDSLSALKVGSAENGHAAGGAVDPLENALNVKPLHLGPQSAEKQRKVEAEVSGLHLSVETVRRVESTFVSEIEMGLARPPGGPHLSSLQMENTYIPELPNGTEEGLYLALDLGGTNFRVILLELAHAPDGGQVQDIVLREEVKRYDVPEVLRLGEGTKLFDYLAYCIHDFMAEFYHEEDHKRKEPIPLGFTFSFPMEQHALDVGILVSWTKSYNCPNTVGRDAVQMLKDAIHRRGDLNVEVQAILNDTTGTLVQGANLDSRTAIGLIIGTGSNACYIEKAAKVGHWEGDRHGEVEVIIDIEWGAFGDNGVLDFLKTEFDREVDNNSLLARTFTFEKYISGKYLGAIVRSILVKLSKDGLLFNGKPSAALLQQNSFQTKDISCIEEDTLIDNTKNTEEILQRLGLQYTKDDILIVQHICELVSNRSALLLSVCLATLIRRMSRPDTTIAVDGSLYKNHPRLPTLMNKYISLLAPGRKFQLMLAEDGSGKGAALIAAIAVRLKKRHMTEAMMNTTTKPGVNGQMAGC